MAPLHRRTARRDEIAAPGQPGAPLGEREPALLRRGAGPDVEHRRLHFAIGWLEAPVGTACDDPIAGTLEPRDGGLGRAGTERGPESLVATLVPTDRGDRRVIERIGGLDRDVIIVGHGYIGRQPPRPSFHHETLQPFPA